MTRKTVGILGGMGTAAGIHFAKRLVDLNPHAKDDARHAAFILHSEPAIPDRTTAFIQGGASPAPAITRSLNRLAEFGAGFGVMICNTAHIYFSEIVRGSKLPLVNMIETAAQSAEGRGLERVGLLATTGTVRAGLYRDAFARIGVQVLTPEASMQERLHAAIYDSEYGLKATGTSVSPEAMATVVAAAEALEQAHGLRHLILGCTELSMLARSSALQRWELIDPVDVLAERCLAIAGLLN